MSTAPQGPARSFVCPACDAEHGTLGALLTCCPRELRAITGWLAAKKTPSLSLRSVIGAHTTTAARRAVWLVLHPADEPEEAA